MEGFMKRRFSLMQLSLIRLSRFSSSVLIALGLWLAIALPTSTQASPAPTSLVSQAAAQLPDPIVQALVQDVVRRTGVAPNAIRILNAIPRTWPDGCLGLATPDTFCTEALQPGWHVRLTDGKQDWLYRTDAAGLVVRLDPELRTMGTTPDPEDRSQQEGWDTIFRMGRLRNAPGTRGPAIVIQMGVVNKPVTTYANAVYALEARRNNRWIQIYTSTGARLIPDGAGAVTLPPEVIPVNQLQLGRLGSNVELQRLEMRGIVQVRYDLPNGKRDVRLQLQRTRQYDALNETNTPQLI